MGRNPINIHVHVESPESGEQQDRIEQLLHRVLAALTIVNAKENVLMTDLTVLTSEVAQVADVEASAVALLGNLSQQIRDLSTDPAALQALADSLDASTNDLAAAVAANTPAAPAPEPVPAPVDDVPAPPVDDVPPVDVPPADAPVDVPVDAPAGDTPPEG